MSLRLTFRETSEPKLKWKRVPLARLSLGKNKRMCVRRHVPLKNWHANKRLRAAEKNAKHDAEKNVNELPHSVKPMPYGVKAATLRSVDAPLREKQPGTVHSEIASSAFVLTAEDV